MAAFSDGRGEVLRDQSCGGALGFALAWTAEAAIATWSPIAEFAGVMLDRGAGVTYIGGTSISEGFVMLDGFKKFILRGNVVDMAVGVVIGAAFGGVVGSLTKGLLTPFIGALVKLPDFSNLKYNVRGSDFLVGDFINAVISFLLIAAAVYFFVVVPVNWLMARMHKAEPAAAPTTKKCPECLSEIPIEAKRCAHCTQVVMGRAA